jgi:hypothetical protein
MSRSSFKLRIVNRVHHCTLRLLTNYGSDQMVMVMTPSFGCGSDSFF